MGKVLCTSQEYFPCLRVIRLEGSNLAVMYKVYYYLRMTKQCIEKTKSDLDYQTVFLKVSSLSNIWNTSDDEIDEEEPSSKDSNFYS